jgi:hypothetical protein
MTTNTHRARLEREADGLIKRKIAVRQLLRSGGYAFSGDDIDKRRCMEDAQRELDRLQRRHDEIKHELDLLDAAREASQARVLAQVAARKAVKVAPTVRKAGSYMTKDMSVTTSPILPCGSCEQSKGIGKSI